MSSFSEIEIKTIQNDFSLGAFSHICPNSGDLIFGSNDCPPRRVAINCIKARDYLEALSKHDSSDPCGCQCKNCKHWRNQFDREYVKAMDIIDTLRQKIEKLTEEFNKTGSFKPLSKLSEITRGLDSV